jgi:hypothetical protein
MPACEGPNKFAATELAESSSRVSSESPMRAHELVRMLSHRGLVEQFKLNVGDHATNATFSEPKRSKAAHANS